MPRIREEVARAGAEPTKVRRELGGKIRLSSRIATVAGYPPEAGGAISTAKWSNPEIAESFFKINLAPRKANIFAGAMWANSPAK